METRNKAGKIATYGLAGILAAGSVLAGGCRAAFVKETPVDAKHYAVYEQTRLGNYARPARDFVPDALKSLDDAAVRPADAENTFSAYKGKLGTEYAEIANWVERTNNSARVALSGADAIVKNLYNITNKKGELTVALTEEQKMAYSKSAEELSKLTYELSSGTSLKHSDLTNLQRQANASGDKELALKVKTLIGELKNNADALRVRTAFQNAILVSEGMYAQLADGLRAEDGFERLRTGYGLEELSGRTTTSHGLEDSIRKLEKEADKHFGRDASIDMDDLTRSPKPGHRFAVLKEAFKKYSNAEMSDKELDSVVYRVDSILAEKAVSVKRDSRGKKTLKFIGAFAVPGLPHYKAAEAWSFMGAKDTVEESVAKDEPNRDSFEASMSAAQKARISVNNLNSVVGNKPAIRGDAFAYSVQALGQTFMIYGIVESATAGSGSGGSSPGSNGNGGNGVPGPHDH